MSTGNFFVKLANDVLEAADVAAARLEESLTLVFGGEKQSHTENPPPTSDFATDDEDQHDMYDEDFGNPLQGITDEVLGGIMENQSKASSPLEHLQAFRSAVTWSEPFIISLVVFQIVIFFLSIYVSRRDRGIGPRLTIMGTIAIIVKSSEYLNRMASRHWARFSTQNYFDKRGVFMSVMVCSPLLLDSLIMLLLFLREASQLLIKYKTIQLKDHIRQRKKDASKNDDGKKKKEAKKEK